RRVGALEPSNAAGHAGGRRLRAVAPRRVAAVRLAVVATARRAARAVDARSDRAERLVAARAPCQQQSERTPTHHGPAFYPLSSSRPKNVWIELRSWLCSSVTRRFLASASRPSRTAASSTRRRAITCEIVSTISGRCRRT